MKLLDEARLTELQELGGDEFVSELWRVYLETCAQVVPELRAAVTAQNFAEIARCAHLLKSASGNVGASGFFDICGKIEAAALAHHGKLSDLMPSLESMYSQTLGCEPARKCA